MDNSMTTCELCGGVQNDQRDMEDLGAGTYRHYNRGSPEQCFTINTPTLGYCIQGETS